MIRCGLMNRLYRVRVLLMVVLRCRLSRLWHLRFCGSWRRRRRIRRWRLMRRLMRLVCLTCCRMVRLIRLVRLLMWILERWLLSVLLWYWMTCRFLVLSGMVSGRLFLRFLVIRVLFMLAVRRRLIRRLLFSLVVMRRCRLLRC